MDQSILSNSIVYTMNSFSTQNCLHYKVWKHPYQNHQLDSDNYFNVFILNSNHLFSLKICLHALLSHFESWDQFAFKLINKPHLINQAHLVSFKSHFESFFIWSPFLVLIFSSNFYRTKSSLWPSLLLTCQEDRFYFKDLICKSHDYLS